MKRSDLMDLKVLHPRRVCVHSKAAVMVRLVSGGQGTV